MLNAANNAFVAITTLDMVEWATSNVLISVVEILQNFVEATGVTAFTKQIYLQRVIYFWANCKYLRLFWGTFFQKKAPDPLPANYVGCFVDNQNRDINGFEQDFTGMTVDFCLNKCTMLNYLYAGLQYGFV